MHKAAFIQKTKEAFFFCASRGGIAGISRGVKGAVQLAISASRPLSIQFTCIEKKADMWRAKITAHRGMLLRSGIGGDQDWSRGGDAVASAALLKRVRDGWKNFRVEGDFLEPQIIEVADANDPAEQPVIVAADVLAAGIAQMNVNAAGLAVL